MRFKTKVDFWLVLVLIVAGFICLMPFLNVSAAPKTPVILRILLPLIWLFILSLSLPQYYEVREEGLFIRQGWKKILLPYASLRELRMVSDICSAPVFSTDRIQIATAERAQFVIAVKEKEQFLTEVSRRSLQLERHSDGLGLRLSSPTIA